MVEPGEVRKGAVVRPTFDAGGIPGWRRQLGHPAWERYPSPSEATAAFVYSCKIRSCGNEEKAQSVEKFIVIYK